MSFAAAAFRHLEIPRPHSSLGAGQPVSQPCSVIPLPASRCTASPCDCPPTPAPCRGEPSPPQPRVRRAVAGGAVRLRAGYLPRRSQAGEEHGNVRCSLRCRFGAHAVGCKIAQRLLSQSDLLQQPHRVQAFERRLPFFLDSRLDAAVCQKPIAWRRRREVDLVNARTIARLRLQLERGLEEVDVQP